jgi:hypothetical protein
MRVARVTRLTDWGGKNTRYATKREPLYVVLVNPAIVGEGQRRRTVHYSCAVLWCKRAPDIRYVSLTSANDEWEVVDNAKWPAQVCAGIAKRTLLGDSFRIE